MTVALWIIAICELIRVGQVFYNLWIMTRQGHQLNDAYSKLHDVEDILNDVNRSTDQSTEEFVKVVKCNECKYADTLYAKCKHPDRFNDPISVSGYCDRGEKK